MPDVGEVLTQTEDRMEKSIDSLKRDLATIRTGRASPTLVESLLITYYGIDTPLNQIASISIPEARIIMIQPWDKSSLTDVEKAIMTSDLGLTPNNDGNSIRLNIPMLTEERRRDLVRVVGKKVEEGNVAVRNIRRDSLEAFRTMEKNKALSQDEGRRAQNELQELTDLYVERIGELKIEKETEVMEV